MNVMAVRYRGLVCAALLAAVGVVRSAAQELTYVDLLDRLIDLERLATLPEPGERCAQWSSFDRKSRYDHGDGEYVNWAANLDYQGILYADGETQVLAEMEGPGVLRRMWSANNGG